MVTSSGTTRTYQGTLVLQGNFGDASLQWPTSSRSGSRFINGDTYTVQLNPFGRSAPLVNRAAQAHWGPYAGNGTTASTSTSPYVRCVDCNGRPGRQPALRALDLGDNFGGQAQDRKVPVLKVGRPSLGASGGTSVDFSNLRVRSRVAT
jgi:hypothetical protein